MFKEDSFLDDFGVPCLKAQGNVSFLGILDMPDNSVDFSGAGALSTDYSLTYLTTEVSFKRDDVITVNRVKYTARGAGEKQDDGVFSKVMLQK
ncbi:hypothetical protein SAMN05216428_112107 [Nitrosospira sp. Nsp11]|uniref:head-tail joining protein n=1 Tax=Nitrosospira sp. Nsp11 TaxID=1855338 RepID=UPI0009193EBF|nr:hypothetical protein [Nitrosospira sp. Nsp11]SHM05991.1 hypothetical protein SAMN05216428_112107 [Nitrosospira sp. Nsp11]